MAGRNLIFGESGSILRMQNKTLERLSIIADSKIISWVAFSRQERLLEAAVLK